MANYEKMYMRPNRSNTGTVPATGGMSSSPDIWISGTSPLPDYQNYLASDQSYAAESSNRVTAGMTNYIYVRAKNGGKEAEEKNVTLYYG